MFPKAPCEPSSAALALDETPAGSVQELYELLKLDNSLLACSHYLDSVYGASSLLTETVFCARVYISYIDRAMCLMHYSEPTQDDDDSILSGYGAGHMLLGWIRGVQRNPNVYDWNRYVVKKCELIVNISDSQLFVTAVLEHLFEEVHFRTLFKSWQNHPKLSVLYDAACEWGDFWGSSD